MTADLQIKLAILLSELLPISLLILTNPIIEHYFTFVFKPTNSKLSGAPSTLWRRPWAFFSPFFCSYKPIYLTVQTSLDVPTTIYCKKPACLPASLFQFLKQVSYRTCVASPRLPMLVQWWVMWASQEAYRGHHLRLEKCRARIYWNCIKEKKKCLIV